MPRGKNYVNNNKGVTLQASDKSKTPMKICEYGAGCTRPDCIYRHEGAGKIEEVCLPFLAGKCTFADEGCRKRHPSKEDCARLLAKYKRTRCRFADECYTEGCLYLHPREVEDSEPFYVEPHNVAFPPLSGSSGPSVTKPAALVNSAWKAAPAVAPSMQANAPAWKPTMTAHLPHHPQHQAQMCTPYYASPGYIVDPSGQYYEQQEVVPDDASRSSFNVHAKEFTPGSSLA